MEGTKHRTLKGSTVTSSFFFLYEFLQSFWLTVQETKVESSAMDQKANYLDLKENTQHSGDGLSFQYQPIMENFVMDVNLIMSRLFSRSYVAVCACAFVLSIFLFLPLQTYHGRRHYQSIHSRASFRNYFGLFEGFSECGIRAVQLYEPPAVDSLGFHKPDTFCRDRKHLLRALSEGGRIGFDAPYQPRGILLHIQKVHNADLFQIAIIDGLISKRSVSF